MARAERNDSVYSRPADSPEYLRWYRLPSDEQVIINDASNNRRIANSSAKLLAALQRVQGR